MSPEIISLLAGSALGGVTKLMAQNAADRQANFANLIKANQVADTSRDDAAKRSSGKAGEWTRRGIILIVLFGVILAPFLLTIFQLPTVVETISQDKSFFFGLFHWGGGSRFYQIYGYLITPELRQSVLAIVGFYFGSSVAKRSNV